MAVRLEHAALGRGSRNEPATTDAIAPFADARSERTGATIRRQIFEEAGEMKVAHERAKRDTRLRLLICMLEECHELFEHKEYGPKTAEPGVRVLKKARKCAITLFLTVSPAKDSTLRSWLACAYALKPLTTTHRRF